MSIGRLPNESPAYAKLRDELQQAEIDLRDQRERVAELRRRLPTDGVVDDEVFDEIRDGTRAEVRLSELVSAERPLVLMQFMFGKKQQVPCPMCTLWADGYDPLQEHLGRRLDFAVLVAGDVGDFADYARTRGWKNLRLVSAAGSDLKRRLGFEAEDGAQYPGVSVFLKNGDGRLIHFYSQSAMLGGGEGRGMDLLSPLWHYLDLTPDGRGDWFPSVRYR